MKFIKVLLFIFPITHGYAQVVLDADGPGNTYELITSVLAPNYNPIETPDCNHTDFGDHIDEYFDTELNSNVFRFYLHTTPDNDRCINFDRQRNEIKTYDQSPDNLLGVEGEKVVYKWKFKLEPGFKSSPNFTHLHQLKSVGGSLASMPMYTLTTRKGNPDRLELRYAETSSQTTLTQTALEPFIGEWLSVIETIEYGTSGTYEIDIKRVSDNTSLLFYSDNNIINWRPGAAFVRPKWGIYRSLINAQDLRDETVSFANFSIEEIEIVFTEDIYSSDRSPLIYTNPIVHTLEISNLPEKTSSIQIVNFDGRLAMSTIVQQETTLSLDVSNVPNGTYALSIQGQGFNHSQLIIISH